MAPDPPPAYYDEVPGRPPSYREFESTDNLAVQPALAASVAEGEHVFSGKMIQVSISRCRSRSTIPIYESRDILQGHITLLSLVNAVGLTIFLKGLVRLVTMKRSLPNITTERTFLSRTVELPLPSSTSTAIPFSFPFSGFEDDDRTPLPASFMASSPDVDIEVTYRMRIHLAKRGFHKDESLYVPILYTSTSIAPPMPVRSPWIQCSSMDMTLNTAFVTLSLPSSTFAANRPIPFRATGLSRTCSPLVVSLSKTVTISQYGQRFQASRTISSVHPSVHTLSDGTWVAGGLVPPTTEIREMSWKGSEIEVSYRVQCCVRCVATEGMREHFCTQRVVLYTHAVDDDIAMT